MRNKFGDEYFFCFVLPYVVKTITHRYEKTHARGDGKLLHLSGRFNQTGLYITRGGFLLVHGTRYSNLMLCKYQFNRSIGVCVCVCVVCGRACVRCLLYNHRVFPSASGCVLSTITRRILSFN